MVDVWQAVLLLLAGAVIGLGSSFVQRLWTKSDILEAEERQEERRIREEEREKIRQRREKTMKPLLDFLDVAKRYVASEGLKATYKRTYQDNLGNVQDKMTEEQWLDEMNKKYPGPTMSDVVLAFSAAGATASTQDILKALQSAMMSLGPEQLAQGKSNAYSAISAVERAIEQYVVVV